MKFYDPQFAKDYDIRMTREGYPGALVDFIHRELSYYKSILDIGAGCGHFAIPLARLGYSVTAVEPSPAMVTIFKEKIRGFKFERRIHFQLARWEDWRCRRNSCWCQSKNSFPSTNSAWSQSNTENTKIFDAALCAYAIYGMKDLPSAIAKMRAHARKTIILVRNDSESVTLGNIIRARLGIPSCAKNKHEEIARILYASGCTFETKKISQVRKTIFCDIKSEVEYFGRHLDIEQQQKEALAQIIKNACNQTADEYYFENHYIDFAFIIHN
jgi:SAM-dependent methyltransferase